MNFKLINEGFERKYGKLDLNESVEIFHNDNGRDYEIVERSKSGQNALLKNPKGSQWIIAYNCPKENEGSWGQGHYFFDEEAAREVWEEKYKNESLKEGCHKSNKNSLKQENKELEEDFDAITYDLFINELLSVIKKYIRMGATQYDLHRMVDDIDDEIKWIIENKSIPEY